MHEPGRYAMCAVAVERQQVVLAERIERPLRCGDDLVVAVGGKGGQVHGLAVAGGELRLRARGARRRDAEPGTLGVVRLGQLQERAEGAFGYVGRLFTAHALRFGLVTAASLRR